MNWVQIIGELADLGYSQTRIADECNIGQATVSDLSRGKAEDPKYSTGKALLALLEKARKEAKKSKA